MLPWLTLLAAPMATAACTDRHCQLSEAHVVSIDPSRPARPPALDRRRPKHTEVATFASG